MGLTAASGCELSGTSATLLSALDTEVVIPNRTEDRTRRRVFSGARHSHYTQQHGFGLFARLECTTHLLPVVRACRSRYWGRDDSARRRIKHIDSGRTARH